MQLAWSVRTELQKPSGSASNRVVSPSSNSGREGAAAWFQVVGGRFVAKMPGQVGDLPHDTGQLGQADRVYSPAQLLSINQIPSHPCLAGGACLLLQIG
jgi:hypothetical protein